MKNNEAERAAILAEIETEKIQANIARIVAGAVRGYPESRKQTVRESKAIVALLEAGGIVAPAISFEGTHHSPSIRVYFQKANSPYTRDYVIFYLDKYKRADEFSGTTHPFHAGTAKRLDELAEEYELMANGREIILASLDEKLAAVVEAGERVKAALVGFGALVRDLPHEAREILIRKMNWQDIYKAC